MATANVKCVIGLLILCISHLPKLQTPRPWSALLLSSLRAFADIDELTQLPRRRRVIELAKRIIHRCERANLPVAVLYLDADRFKSINDIFGHDAGDRALTLIAAPRLARARQIALPK